MANEEERKASCDRIAKIGDWKFDEELMKKYPLLSTENTDGYGKYRLTRDKTAMAARLEKNLIFSIYAQFRSKINVFVFQIRNGVQISSKMFCDKFIRLQINFFRSERDAAQKMCGQNAKSSTSTLQEVSPHDIGSSHSRASPQNELFNE